MESSNDIARRRAERREALRAAESDCNREDETRASKASDAVLSASMKKNKLPPGARGRAAQPAAAVSAPNVEEREDFIVADDEEGMD